ncbi:MAG: TolC family protein [Bacteroidota bacterium]
MHNRILITLLLFSTASFSQKITLQDAVGIALDKNLQIQIARNEAEIAHKQNSAGAAGMLPSVTLNAADNPSLTNLKQELANGTVIERDNVFTNNVNANVTLGYTLFDGMRMFATRKRLKELEAMGFNRMKAQVQNMMSNVIQKYSYLVAQQASLKVVEQLLDISKQRYDLVQVRVTAGMANNTDVYLAQLDMDTRKQNLINQQVLIKNGYADLNVVLNLPVDSVYGVDTLLVTNTTLQKSQLDTAFNNNPELLMAQNSTEIALQSQKELQGVRLPLIRLNAAYGYTLTQSQAGFTLLNQNYGPNAGISLGLPLYTGNVNANNVAVAKLQYKNAALSQQQTRLSLSSNFEQAWATYTNALVQVTNDEASVKTAQNYLDLMQQRYKGGQSTVLDYREAQRSYEETNYRLVSNRYNLKLAETDLLRLTGQLVN